MAKASDTEEEYFARENAERMRKLAAEQKKSLAESEREKLRQLHHMRCPKCGMELKEIDAAAGWRSIGASPATAPGWTRARCEKLAKGQPENTVMAAVLRVFGAGKRVDPRKPTVLLDKSRIIWLEARRRGTARRGRRTKRYVRDVNPRGADGGSHPVRAEAAARAARALPARADARAALPLQPVLHRLRQDPVPDARS